MHRLCTDCKVQQAQTEIWLGYRSQKGAEYSCYKCIRNRNHKPKIFRTKDNKIVRRYEK